jgi:hypothetical protein
VSLPTFHRITAWLCLWVALAAGVVPAQGFLLCVEQDGCVSLELGATADHCADCAPHACGGAGEKRSAAEIADARCQCVDLAIPGSTKIQPLRLKSSIAPWLDWLALLPTALAPPMPRALASRWIRATPIEAPRPPDTLRLMRGVVILV